MGEIRASIGTYSVDPKKLMERHLQKILNQRIQVYYDRGSGFREEDSCYMPDIYVGEYEIEANIPFDGNVKGLRIDPADRSCMVKIKELRLNETDVPLQKKYIQTNGKTVKPGCYVFESQDPNVCIAVSELPRNGENLLLVKMELAPVPEDMANDMTGAVKRLF